LKTARAPVRQEIRRALNRYANGSKADVRLLDASVPEGIRRAAMEEKADLVIVGRGHEKGTLSRMWSALYGIIRESPCPVLSV
jgi:nucleotide-binding universal stress UspA family protein